MSTTEAAAEWAVEDLLAAVQRLSPDRQFDFARQFIAWQQKGSGCAERDAELVDAARMRLPAADERRLKQLAAKSEQSTLGPEELREYQHLAQQAQQLDVRRIRALAELAKRRGKPASTVMQEIGWRSGTDAP